MSSPSTEEEDDDDFVADKGEEAKLVCLRMRATESASRRTASRRSMAAERAARRREISRRARGRERERVGECIFEAGKGKNEGVSAELEQRIMSNRSSRAVREKEQTTGCGKKVAVRGEEGG